MAHAHDQSHFGAVKMGTELQRLKTEERKAVDKTR